MSDIRERFGAFDRLDMPDLWDEAQHREPRPTKGPHGNERAKKVGVIITALALTIATTGVMIRAFRHAPDAQPVTGTSSQWPVGTVPNLGLSFRYPPEWRLQPFNDQMRVSFEGVLVSNTDLEFRHPDIVDGATTAWDLSRLPLDGAVISIEHIAGGPAPSTIPTPADTPLPLSLSRAKLLTPQQDPLGYSPKPAGTQERFLAFLLNGQRDVVRVFFGPGASLQSRDAVADVVASIERLTPPVALVHVPLLTGMSLRDARDALTSVGLKVGKVTDQPVSDPVGTVSVQRPGPVTLVEPGTSVDLEISSGIPGNDLGPLACPAADQRATIFYPKRQIASLSPSESASSLVQRTFRGLLPGDAFGEHASEAGWLVSVSRGGHIVGRTFLMGRLGSWVVSEIAVCQSSGVGLPSG